MSGAVGSSRPRPAKPVRLSSREKNAVRRAGVGVSAHSTSAFVHAASRAARTFHIAIGIVGVAARGIDQRHDAGGELDLDLRFDRLEQIVDLVEVVVAGTAFGRRAFGRPIAGDDRLREGRG